MSKEFLSPEEKSRVIAFNSDPMMKSAVEKVLLSSIYNTGTLTPGEPAGIDTNWAYGCDNGTGTDEEVGKRLRIKTTALSYLEAAMKELATYRVEVEPTPAVNEAI